MKLTVVYSGIHVFGISQCRNLSTCRLIRNILSFTYMYNNIKPVNIGWHLENSSRTEKFEDYHELRKGLPIYLSTLILKIGEANIYQTLYLIILGMLGIAINLSLLEPGTGSLCVLVSGVGASHPPTPQTQNTQRACPRLLRQHI